MLESKVFTSLLTTKLYIPRLGLVSRQHLIERLSAGSSRLTLVSAHAGFGKTTLVSEWIASCKQPVAWLSLDEWDNDPACFLTDLIAALQKVAPKFGERALVLAIGGKSLLCGGFYLDE
jgi:LuxR family transcriptional regulator, maltose regulon positive regulatory protein